MHIVIVSVALLFQSSAIYYFFFEYVNYFFIDKSRAAYLCVGCARTVCPSLSGNNGALAQIGYL